MKFMAFYLPQYHEIPENNKWWGEGFTDWVNVKKAKKYFGQHNQPRIPLNNWYYDLSKTEDIRKQVDIANKYNIYGFCFYHYWFHGKLLLEKPVELLRLNEDISTHYCFSWANEPWARTWDGKNHDYLIEQEYGDAHDWKIHFEYFLPYFLDKRYIKIRNKPMLIIYKPSSIPCLKEMLILWNKLAVQHGFDGLHYVETLRSDNYCDNDRLFSAFVEFEPARSLTPSKVRLWYNRARRYTIFAYNRVTHSHHLCNNIIPFKKIMKKSLAYENKPNTYGGLFMGWDNSPRKKELATIVTQPTAEEFRYYVNEKIKATCSNNDKSNRFIFINAWNEWAEGTYLEPDTVNQYMYLDILREASRD